MSAWVNMVRNIFLESHRLLSGLACCLQCLYIHEAIQQAQNENSIGVATTSLQGSCTTAMTQTGANQVTNQETSLHRSCTEAISQSKQSKSI